MAGLSLNGTPTVLTAQQANTLITVTPSSGSWADYTGSSSWALYGPERDTSVSLTHPTSATTLEDKTFTPYHCGNYLVVVTTQAVAAPTVPIRLTALIEVTSAYSDRGFPAPTEEYERDSIQGWSRSLESHVASYLQQSLMYRKIIVVSNDTVSSLGAGTIVKLNTPVRMSTAGDTGATPAASAFPQDTVHAAVAIDATSTDAIRGDLAYLLDPLPAASGSVLGTGRALLYGQIPFDTQLALTADEALYLTNAGMFGSGLDTHGSVLSTGPGTYKRVLGRVLLPALPDLLDNAGGFGAIWFDGRSGALTNQSQAGIQPVDSLNTPYTVVVGDSFIEVDTTTAVQVTLPEGKVIGPNYEIVIKDSTGNASAANITIAASGADTIDGAATAVMSTDWDCFTLRSHSTGWYITSLR